METLCHDPQQKLHGFLLNDYNNSRCEMKQRQHASSRFYICSCSHEECNEHVFFSSGESHRALASYPDTHNDP